jgi:hypothetical protein
MLIKLLSALLAAPERADTDFCFAVTARKRTKEAMKAAKDRGVHCGVTSKIPLEIVERVVNERLSGTTWMGICDGLDADGVQTAREAEFWQVGSVQSVFNSSRGKAYRKTLEVVVS